MRLALSLLMLAIIVAPASAAEDAFLATIPFEVLEIDPAIATGGIKFVALQPARVARGIIIERAGGRRVVLALALLGPPEIDGAGKARLDGPPARQAWCELPSAAWSSVMQDYAPDCYRDKDGDGALDTQYRGHLRGDYAYTQVLGEFEIGYNAAPFVR